MKRNEERERNSTKDKEGHRDGGERMNERDSDRKRTKYNNKERDMKTNMDRARNRVDGDRGGT